MSAATHLTPRGRMLVWLGAAAGLALVAGANWHLVHVAMSSQPACVDHLRAGAGNAERGAYSAAKSSCTPRATP
jgi:hypothetical protein